MRRTIVLSTVLAVSTAVLGACEAKPEAPNKPAPTPAPVVTGSPAPTPSVSPVKPGTTPEVKKTDDKKTPDAKDVNKDVKLQGTPVKSPQK